jgi:hypothetical protein
MRFEENNLHIYDVEVLSFEIKDREIQSLLTEAELDGVRRQLKQNSEQERVTFELKSQELKRIEQAAYRDTELKILENKDIVDNEKRKADKAALDYQTEVLKLKLESETHTQSIKNKIASEELIREKALNDETIRVANENLSRLITQLEKTKDCDVARAAAITPDLIAALQSLGDKLMIGDVSKNLNLVAAIGGLPLMDTLKNILQGHPISGVIEEINNSRK